MKERTSPQLLQLQVLVPELVREPSNVEHLFCPLTGTHSPSGERITLRDPELQPARQKRDVVLFDDFAPLRKNLIVDGLARVPQNRTAARKRLHDADAAGFFPTRIHEHVQAVVKTTQVVQ